MSRVERFKKFQKAKIPVSNPEKDMDRSYSKRISEVSEDGFSIEIQSGAFRFYPNDNRSKQAIWKLKEKYDIKSQAEDWNEVWALYFFPLGEGIFRGWVQK